jgi:hypothetical protein
MINPTIKKEMKRAKSVTFKHSRADSKESKKEDPATTMKFVAYVEKRRKDMEDKK